MLICILLSMALPVSAMEFTAPTVPADVEELMPAEQDTFAAGLWKVLTRAVGALQPKTAEAARLCVSLIAIAILTAMLRQLPGGSNHLVELVGCIAVACLLLSRTDTMIRLGSETVAQVEDNVRLLDQTVELTPEQMAEIRENFLNTDPHILNPGTWPKK